MKHDKHPCGCLSERDRERWTQLCPQHAAEVQARHEAHRAEMDRQRKQRNEEKA